VGELRFGVYASPPYLARSGTPAHPSELEGTHHRTVGFLRAQTGKIAPITLQRDGERIDVQGRYVVALDDGNAYLAAGVAGMGIISLPHYMAEAHVARGELVPLFKGWHLDPMPLYLVFPPNRHVSAKLQAFIAWVDELIAQHAQIAPGRGRVVRPTKGTRR
jgi:DNA-binding transcriptional LysR family regulator